MALTTSQPGVRTSWWTLNSYVGSKSHLNRPCISRRSKPLAVCAQRGNVKSPNAAEVPLGVRAQYQYHSCPDRQRGQDVESAVGVWRLATPVAETGTDWRS